MSYHNRLRPDPCSASLIQVGLWPTRGAGVVFCRECSVRERVAVLLDGEYVKKVIGRRIGRFPETEAIMAIDRLES